MKPKTKRAVEYFSFYDHTGIEERLEKMAAEGWMLEEMGPFWWTYKPIEAAKIRFAVTYFSKASPYDPAPLAGQEELAEFCAQSGWKLVHSAAQLQVFKNENENPVPLETDPQVQIGEIHKSAKKSFIPVFMMLIALGLVNAGTFLSEVGNNLIGVLATDASLFRAAGILAMCFLGIYEIGGYLIWHGRAKAYAREGKFLATKRNRIPVYATIAILLAFLALWIVRAPNGYVTIAIVLGVALAAIIPAATVMRLKKKAGASTKTVFIGAIVASAVVSATVLALLVILALNVYKANEATEEEMPLAIEDLLDQNNGSYTNKAEKKSSLFLDLYEAKQWPQPSERLPSLEYTLILPKSQAVYNLCKAALLDEYSFAYGESWIAEDPDLWDAQEAYQKKSNALELHRYVVFWENRALQIDFYWEPSDEQIKAVAEKIKLWE
ncbi:MAG: DUF2812 domain-containing protein [Clostridiales bacterium]|jgi:hypothetical protein|nr:DUF2812 domain-containing protein [Clostridiales bacterium]